MKISCDVIRDLLPLYAEDMVSRDSRVLVETHLGDCPECKAALEALREPVQILPEPEPERLLKLGKRMLQRMILLAMVMVLIVSTVVTWTFAVLGVGSVPVSREDAVLGITEEDGQTYVEIRVCGYLSWWSERDERTPSPLYMPELDVGSEVMCLSVNRRIWDMLFAGEITEKIYQIPVRDAGSVWYLEGSSAQCIWGDATLTPKGNVDPVPWTVLFAIFLLLLLRWLTGWKWTRTGILFFLNVFLADFAVSRCVWHANEQNGVLTFWLLLLFMSLLLTACEVIAYQLWKDRS